QGHPGIAVYQWQAAGRGRVSGAAGAAVAADGQSVRAGEERAAAGYAGAGVRTTPGGERKSRDDVRRRMVWVRQVRAAGRAEEDESAGVDRADTAGRPG